VLYETHESSGNMMKYMRPTTLHLLAAPHTRAKVCSGSCAAAGCAAGYVCMSVVLHGVVRGAGGRVAGSGGQAGGRVAAPSKIDPAAAATARRLL
jgi:hypothetical protein